MDSSSAAEKLRHLRRHRMETPAVPQGRVVPGSQKRRHDPEDDLFLLPESQRRFAQIVQMLQSYSSVFQGTLSLSSSPPSFLSVCLEALFFFAFYC